MSAIPPRPGRPRLVDPELAARVPGLRRVAGIALAVAALSAVVVVVQAVALAHVVDRSLLHHAPLGAVAPAIVLVGLAIVARVVLHGAGDLSAHGAADRVVARLRSELLRHALALGPGWLAGERPGELSLTATRGLRSLHTYYARYLPQAAAAAVIPVILLAWVATQDWLSFVVVIALVVAVPVTMIYFGRESTRRSERQWRRLGSLAGRFLQLVEGLPTLRAFGREEHGRREVEAATEGVRSATMRTLRVAFLSALSMDMIAGFGVGFVAMVLGLRLLWGELDLADRHGRPPGGARDLHPAAPGRAPSSTPAPRGRPRRRAWSRCWRRRSRGPRRPRPPGRRRRRSRSDLGLTRRGADLAVDGLRVEYAHRDRPALTSFSLHAPPGSRLALDRAVGMRASRRCWRPCCASSSRTRAPCPSTAVRPARRARRSGGPTSRGCRNGRTSSTRPWPRTCGWALPTSPDADLRRVLAAVGLSELMANLPAGLRHRRSATTVSR